MRTTAAIKLGTWKPLASAIAGAMVALALLSCTQDAKYQACKVDSECKEDFGTSAYCMRSHCVECVGHASCRNGERCIDGTCESQNDDSTASNLRSVRFE